MKSVLITGSNGFVGQRLCISLRDRGWNVYGAVRSVPPNTDLLHGIELMPVGDLRSNPDWKSILSSKGIDVVVHLAARAHVLKETSQDPLGEFRKINVSATEHLARACVNSNVQRFVFLSSIGAVASLSNAKLTENSPCCPETVYGKSKLEAEKILTSVSIHTGLDVVILRSSLVYGPKNPGNFLRFLALIEKGYPLPFGLINNFRSFIFVENLVDAIIACISHPKAAKEIFHVADGEEISTPELVRRIVRILNRPSRLFSVPPFMMIWMGRLLGKADEVDRLLGSLVVDSSKIRQLLSWKPPFTMDQGLKQTVNWYWHA